MSDDVLELLRSVPHATRRDQIFSTLEKLRDKKHALESQNALDKSESDLRLAGTQKNAIDENINLLQNRLAFIDANKERKTVEAKPQRSDFETRAGSTISDSMGIDVAEHKGDPQDFLEVEAKQFALENCDITPSEFIDAARYYAEVNSPHFADKNSVADLAAEFFNKACAEHKKLQSNKDG